MEQRYWLFLLGCIPTRLSIALAAALVPLRFLPYIGYLTLVMAIGFVYLYVTGKRAVGIETGGRPIWWRPYRLMHGLLYLTFSLLAIAQVRMAYVIIVLDTLIGLGLFVRQHQLI
jgi:hypothetical protein